MIKLIGALLIIASGAGLGLSKYFSQKRGVDTLCDIISALEIMRGEICVRLTPLPELMNMLSERGSPGVRKMFGGVYGGMDSLSETSFSAIWDESLGELAEISADDLSALKSLGSSLGRFGAKEQEIVISRIINQLSLSAEKGRERLKGAGKLYVGLGAGLCAMAAAVLL